MIMIKKTKTVVLFAGFLLAGDFALVAGNKDRTGEAGATELGINPWARSSGWAGANSASVRGLEAMYGNIAGTAFTKKTELVAVNTNWLGGSGIKINAFGLTQHVGSSGVIGLGVMSMGFGEIDITTSESPEGGMGKFSPQYLNVNVSYAKGFSDNIYGGVNIKSVSQQLSDVRAQGVALDAGIQYVTGKLDNLKFGITIRNIGPKMSYKGDGLALRVPLPNNPTSAQSISVEQKSAAYSLPTAMNIGLGYDFYLLQDSSGTDKTHRLTVAGNFTSNSFAKDEIKLGVEYGWKSLFMVRAGYNYESGIWNSDDRTTAHIGPCVGATVETPMKKGGQSTFGLDYSYRVSNPFQGTHSIGIRINL